MSFTKSLQDYSLYTEENQNAHTDHIKSSDKSHTAQMNLN